MKIVDISKFEDSVVLYFDTSNTRINAYTLASILVSIADAAKAANSSINAGHDIEIVVEAVGEGSFKAKISAVYSESKNIFSSQIVAGVIIGLLSNYIYERVFSLDESIKVEINSDEVIIEKGDERIVVPRNVYDATREAEKNPKFVQSIERTFQAIEKDSDIKGFGFAESMDSGKPKVILSREAIILASGEVVEAEGVRVIPEIVELQILKAILERGKRKWEFMWRGIKISAPITSQSFYTEFFNHDITIAPGDSLKVKLEIKQVRNEDTGIYVNKSYEVVEVYNHIPRLKQSSLENT
ncbi:MAG: hypothetical protein Q8L15_19120 [Methylobacter sp.]|nr:hypothetical protein [Methylobacter sp.]